VKAHFDFLGLTIAVESEVPALVEEVRRDFSYFSSAEGPAGIRMDLHRSPPPYKDMPAVLASFVTPRNICFRQNDTSFADYFGRGLAISDRKRGYCTVYAEDDDLLHEITYLYMLSTVGQWLDRRGIHRLHALGVTYRDQGILILLPSGGGKSTTALQLLREPGFRLLSEDTPLIDRSGQILPFPLRLGVRLDQETGIPPQFLRTMKRMEFDPKKLIDLEYFRDRLGAKAAPALLLVGQRSLGENSEITPLERAPAFKALFSNMIIGMGVYQGLEFLLDRGLWDLAGKLNIVVSRTRNSLALLRRTRAHHFVMGRDLGRNMQTLLSFIEKNCGGD
jgi:hypothetical protein